MAGARQLVDAPSFSTLPYGLWDAAQKPPPPDHWQAGITFAERCPAGDTTYDECITVTGTGSPPAPPSKADNVLQNFRGAQPFTVSAEFDCSPVGLADASTVAVDALARVEARQVETAFWTGTAGGQEVVLPHLAEDTSVTDTNGIILQSAASVVVTGTDVVIGLGLLEDALGDCYRGLGVIHIPRTALPTFLAWNLVVQGPNGGLFTVSGHRVVVSDGYTGSGPDGSAPAAGTAWIYATGSVFGYRSDVRFFRAHESFDRSENTMRMIAERTYVMAYECCLFAALITLGTAG